MDRNVVESSDGADDLETIINDIAAEQAVLRITLQCMLLSFFKARREAGPQALSELKAAVARSIERMREDPRDGTNARRWKKLASLHADQLFLELDDAMGRSLSERSMVGSH